jgi:hypothetical protein
MTRSCSSSRCNSLHQQALRLQSGFTGVQYMPILGIPLCERSLMIPPTRPGSSSLSPSVPGTRPSATTTTRRRCAGVHVAPSFNAHSTIPLDPLLSLAPSLSLRSTYYHMQEQSPGYPHGDGDCASPACDCGTMPCGFYLWNHSSTAVVNGQTFLDWFIHSYMFNAVGSSPLVSGFFWVRVVCVATRVYVGLGGN